LAPIPGTPIAHPQPCTPRARIVPRININQF
ncbi:hypothetical protein AFLA70_455g000851, partial [Aspergillus flavus AF70]